MSKKIHRYAVHESNTFYDRITATYIFLCRARRHLNKLIDEYLENTYHGGLAIYDFKLKKEIVSVYTASGKITYTKEEKR